MCMAAVGQACSRKASGRQGATPPFLKLLPLPQLSVTVKIIIAGVY